MIKTIEIINFKFHKKININLQNLNLFIYGENGVGKSSIYNALNFTFIKLLRNKSLKITDQYKNRDLVPDDTNINIEFENNSNLKFLNLKKLEYSGDKINKNNVYFSNQDLLQFIIDEEDFFIVIEKKLNQHFTSLDTQYKKYQKIIKDGITSLNYRDINDIRAKSDKRLQVILDKISTKANKIIKDKFLEDFKINFILKKSEIVVDDDYTFIAPIISLNINSLDDLKNNFNESTLKLTSIAIYFALINLNKKTNEYSLLVLDDFLTSLDMSNRAFILEYIFTEYASFQKIILTHNLQFYNVAQSIIKHNGQASKWSFQNIYTRNTIGSLETKIYEKPDIDLDEIEKNLSNIEKYSEFRGIGNLLRQQFERIIHELDKEMKLGTKEKTNTILSSIKSNKEVYLNQNNIIDELNSVGYTEPVKELIKKNTYPTKYLNEILHKLIFYKKIVMHTASHHDIDSDIFHKEFKQTIILLKELDKELKVIQSLNSQGA